VRRSNVLITAIRYVRYSDCPSFDAAFKEAEWSSQADGAQGQHLQIVWQQHALEELRAAIAGGCMRFVSSEQVQGLELPSCMWRDVAAGNFSTPHLTRPCVHRNWWRWQRRC
jgi:hypothetical protein